MKSRLIHSALLATLIAVTGPGCKTSTTRTTPGKLTTPATPGSSSPFADYRAQSPGRTHKVTAADLPPPFATRSSDNGPDLVPRPEGAWPQAPAGFQVQLYAQGLSNPRLIRTAPSGDFFVAESDEDRVLVFRGVDAQGRAREKQVFASDLRKPFGLAFHPPTGEPSWLYVGNTDQVVRFPYRSGDLTARGPAQKVVDLPGGGRLRGGGHWTRDIAFSLDGKKMFVSVGSLTNKDDPDTNQGEQHRANILEFDPEGGGMRVYAYGIRNPVGIAVNPRTGQLWTSVNERDELGDNLVPDYITSVKEGGFYGWPWYYIGANQDPDHQGKHPELRDKVIVPDVLLQPHFASLQLMFYEGKQFPAEYHGDIFAAEHGSWNRSIRTGYQVIRVPLRQQDRASGEYQDFLTGFVTPAGDVWGRPVGVTLAPDGSLLVTDDGSNSIWRVSYTGK
jgi:glucose/arabinose dehydrogenase